MNHRENFIKLCLAPEILQGGKNTKQSDVYNVGMLTREVFAGHPSFDDKAHDVDLIFQILEGLQPQICLTIMRK